MRVNTLTGELASIIRRVRKTGFTIAPEAGTQRLRNVINKGITDDDILNTVEEAFSAGWELIKLYFMIGLPTETADDIEGAIDLVHRVHKLARRVSKHRFSQKRGSAKAKLNVSFSSFVPKTHTPFQWDRFFSREELNTTQRHLQNRIRNRSIQLKWHDVDASYLEAIFARGDRRLGRVLVEAHKLGCKFDGWREHFDFSAWMQAFKAAGLDQDWYAFRERDRDESLPWDHIESGVSRDFLWQERQKGLLAEGSPPCTPHCRRCGLCNDDASVIRASDNTPPVASDVLQDANAKPEARVKAFRLRVAYAKTGLLRFLSHLELNRVFQRALARIHAPVAYSQGYNPHPLISFGPALPVGMEGLRELVDVFFSEAVEPEQFVDAMNATLPAGIRLHQASVIDIQASSLSVELKHFVYHITLPTSLTNHHDFTGQTLQRLAETFYAQDTYVVAPFKKRADGLDIRPFFTALDVHIDEVEQPWIHVALSSRDNVMLKPEDVLHLVFHIPYEQILDCRIVRIECT
jgi:radical SAM-linked protein